MRQRQMVIAKRFRGPRKVRMKVGLWPVLFFMILCAVPAWIVLSETYQRMLDRESPVSETLRSTPKIDSH